MKLDKKKNLAAATLGVGRDRVVFNTARLDEIKEAITKQDIRDLVASGAIAVKEITGKKVKVKRRTRRRAGSIKKKVKGGKREYMILTRKLRRYLAELRKNEAISEERYQKLRKEIRAHAFRSKTHMKERMTHLQ